VTCGGIPSTDFGRSGILGVIKFDRRHQGPPADPFGGAYLIKRNISEKDHAIWTSIDVSNIEYVKE